MLSSPAGRALVDGYQRLVCDCTLEYVLNRLPLLVTLQLVAPGVLYGFGIREPARVWAALPRLQVKGFGGNGLGCFDGGECVGGSPALAAGGAGGGGMAGKVFRGETGRGVSLSVVEPGWLRRAAASRWCRG